MNWSLAFLVLLSCQQDYGFVGYEECDLPEEIIVEVPAEVPAPTPPDIEVSPLESEFGWLVVADNETYRSTFSIFNLGGTELEINNIYLSDPNSEYTLDFVLQNVDPSGVMGFDVIFEPLSSGLKPESVFIESNDPDEPLVEVIIQGTGLAPKIEVNPMAHDFGQPPLSCPEEVETTIRNLGTADLEINNITYSGTGDLQFEFDYDLYGVSPWLVAPNEEIVSTIIYVSYDEVYDIGYLTVESNDPLSPIVIASQEGDAMIGDIITDSFIQEETEEVDILFVIDNSCSMSDEQAKLATNAVSFVTTLDASGADYRLATITTDSSIFQGPVLSPGYPDLISEFENQLVAGTTGNTTEVGLEMAYRSTLPGGDAEVGGVFQRAGAILSVVFVSDEDDYSILDVGTYYVSHFQSLKTSPDKVLLHAVAGDPYVLDTCGSSPAYRYEEAVALTAGIFSSICSDDWALGLVDLANGSLVPNLDFPLTEIPVEYTIEIYVDGVLVTTGWSYDPAANSVVFIEEYAPEGGELVEITYGYYTECP